MPKIILILIVTGIIIASCEQKSPQFQPESSVRKDNFFPVTQYLLGQLRELDSLPVTPLKITTANNTVDSIWLTREAIRSFAKPFTDKVIDSASLYNYFSQASFLDQTINAFTFSYDPLKKLPDSMEIKHWDIYIDPASNKVNHIYIVRQLKTDLETKTLQLTWKSGYYCQIRTITEKGKEPPEIKEEKLIWNFND